MASKRKQHSVYESTEPIYEPWLARLDQDAAFQAALHRAIARGDEHCAVGVVLTPSTKAPLMNYTRGET